MSKFSTPPHLFWEQKLVPHSYARLTSGVKGIWDMYVCYMYVGGRGDDGFGEWFGECDLNMLLRKEEEHENKQLLFNFSALNLRNLS